MKKSYIALIILLDHILMEKKVEKDTSNIIDPKLLRQLLNSTTYHFASAKTSEILRKDYQYPFLNYMSKMKEKKDDVNDNEIEDDINNPKLDIKENTSRNNTIKNMGCDEKKKIGEEDDNKDTANVVKKNNAVEESNKNYQFDTNKNNMSNTNINSIIDIKNENYDKMENKSEEYGDNKNINIKRGKKLLYLILFLFFI